MHYSERGDRIIIESIVAEVVELREGYSGKNDWYLMFKLRDPQHKISVFIFPHTEEEVAKAKKIYEEADTVGNVCRFTDLYLFKKIKDGKTYFSFVCLGNVEVVGLGGVTNPNDIPY